MTTPLIPPTPSDTAYKEAKISEPITPLDNPFDMFAAWLNLAHAHEPNDPNAMCLATVDADGVPDARMVLLKEFEAPHLGFYTNYESAKAQHLAAHPTAALLFHWKSLRRQVRIRGAISKNTPGAADAYFATRSRKSQIGAISSKQSQTLPSRATLVSETEAINTAFAQSEPVKRPTNWGGYLLKPVSFEFWLDQPYRLHDRVQYQWHDTQENWTWRYLYP